MASRVLQRLARVVAAVFVVSLVLAGSASARPTVPRTRSSSRGFNLFAGSTNVVMNVNHVQCNINNIGESCVDPTNSPVLGGGFWPKGSPDQYIFNAGLQIAAIIPGNKTATFNWPGDTVGAFFFDPRGDQTTGESRTATFSSLRTDDLANWPTAAYANDTSLYASSLIGRANVSQQDVWSRFWDGNVGLAAGARKHPMGILVESRGLAWNFPTGNEDIIYFITRFINITSGTRSDYDGLANSGYSTTDIDDIFAIAQDFRSRSQAAFNTQIPAGGFAWSNVYASFAEDPDVGNASLNYSNANLIFNMAMAWKSDFKEPTWQFPPTIFGAPFLPNPGFEAAKYLKTPGNLGVTMAGNTTNGVPFPDAVGVSRLWRNLSGNLLPTDGSCSVPNPVQRRFCQWVQTAVDTRFYAASGPFSVGPGQLSTIVVALVHAAPVGASPAATPTCTAGFTCTAVPAFSLVPFIGADMKPGFSIEGRRLATGLDAVRDLDRAIGMLNFNDVNGDSVISQTEVTTVPRSLVNKGLVAQNVFDNKFLLPFAPEVPLFFLVPGDNQVTIAWQKSNTETIGDPFFAVASLPINPITLAPNPLYDPNFRKFDVEGYRIWRGRTQSEMAVIASFDYSSSTFKDYTGSVFNASFPNCAPELGATFNGTTPCGTTYTTPTSAVLVASSKHTDYDISGVLIQVPPGGRVQLANGTILQLTLDSAVVGGGSSLPALTDGGVPFAYTDHGVRNGFSYVYAVTAFDVNSVASGPSSLESPLVTKTIIPRAPSGQTVAGALGALVLLGRSATPLDPTAAVPTIGATTGIFSGSMPPTNAISAGFAAFLPDLLTDGSVTVTVDSIVPGSFLTNVRPATYWFTGQGSGAPVKFSLPITGAGTSNENSSGADVDITASAAFPATAFSTAQSSRFGGDSTYSIFGSASVSVNGDYRYINKGRADANGDPSGPFNGPRWWAGAANENTNDPNGFVCGNAVVGNGSFSCTLTDLSRNAGSIAGVGIFAILAYTTEASSVPGRDFEGITSSVFRAADFKWYWGAAGAVDSVVDVTHNVRVPFNKKIRASWGILNDSSFTNTVAKASVPDTSITRLTWSDIYCVAPAPNYLALCGGVGNFTAPDSGAFLMNHARLAPVSFASSSFGGTQALAASASTGNGFIIYLDGYFFMIQVAAFPAAGTVWNLRTYAGNITGSVGSYGYRSATRPAAVPGLRAQISYTGSTFNTASTNDSLMANIHTVPDPYYVTNALELTSNTKVLRFVNLPSQAIIRIYSSSGILVNILSHNDATGGGEQVWNLRNRNNQFVASGVYFYHVEGPDGHTKVGRFTVVNYAQ